MQPAMAGFFTAVLKEVVDAADSQVPSSALQWVCGLCRASVFVIYVREECQMCAWSQNAVDPHSEFFSGFLLTF